MTCLINKTMATFHVTAVENMPLSQITKVVSIWIYSYEDLFAAWGLECILVHACFVATGLNAWHHHF